MIDWAKLCVYLKAKFAPDVIYFAAGYVGSKRNFYQKMIDVGYTMLFKEVGILPNGEIKGNVDIDIAIRSILEMSGKIVTKAYLITNDGDYNTLLSTFKNYNILGYLLTPNLKNASKQLKRITDYVIDLKDIQYKIKKDPIA